jgi:hypothetical protein
MRGLDPRICNRTRVSIIVIPAKAGIQLNFADAPSWTPAFAWVTKKGECRKDDEERSTQIGASRPTRVIACRDVVG